MDVNIRNKFNIRTRAQGDIRFTLLDTILKHMKSIIFDINKTSKVLDFGSGPGIMSEFFDEYIGIDTDKSRIEFASNMYPNKIFEKIDPIDEMVNNELPFVKEYFDVVLFNDCINHISDENMNLILIEINRVLKRNGIIIIREPKKDTNIITYIITEMFVHLTKMIEKN